MGQDLRRHRDEIELSLCMLQEGSVSRQQARRVLNRLQEQAAIVLLELGVEESEEEGQGCYFVLDVAFLKGDQNEQSPLDSQFLIRPHKDFLHLTFHLLALGVARLAISHIRPRAAEGC